MGEVVFDISMSLEGFITGPNEGIEHPLGEAMDGSTTGSSTVRPPQTPRSSTSCTRRRARSSWASGSSTWGWRPGVIRRRSTCRYLW
jgi:hypothetical protein